MVKIIRQPKSNCLPLPDNAVENDE